MFYTYLLLGKRGALSKIWIAAHWEKKLTKAHIFECNLDLAIQSIMAPKVVIALRTSGHLLLGVVRIYHRKAKYLLADCNEAILKMKTTFRPGALDLADDNKEASYNAITLPEEFYEFDTQLPDLNLIDVVDHFTLNQSRIEDITIREDYGRQLILHDGFGDYLDTFRQDSPKDDSFEVSTNSYLPEQSSMSINGEERDRFNQDCFGDEGTTTSDFFDNSQIFIESTNPCADRNVSKEVIFPASPPEDEKHLEATLGDDAMEMTLEHIPAANNTTLLSNEDKGFVLEPVDESALGDDAKEMPVETTVLNNTTLLSNEEDGFILEPLDVSAIQIRKRSKRKRKLMVDNLKEISSSCMREQLINISDTLTSFDIAPPTHSLMERNITGGVQWLLSCPTQPIINTDLLLLFTQCKELDTSKHVHEEQAEPEIETLRKEQEEFDLPQLEMTTLTDVSSSYTEEPSNMHDLTTYNLTTSNASRAVQEHHSHPLHSKKEMVDPLLYASPRCLTEEEIIPPTENVQDSGEHQWSKRTHEMLGGLRKLHQSGVSSFSLQKLCRNNKRKQVSGKFYSFLVLTKQSAIKMRQSAPYSDIIAIPGSRFHTL
ncbi:double-strand-break repair protein rad21-like protein 1 isoform X2 [Pseudophryne corroboree]|uniref:double-strand-break repair protein rad21-like protein 1 isoform X2 n=1 Tax=Pseudophryne corroboree TaxID=495146 RepID=UPI003081A9AD